MVLDRADLFEATLRALTLRDGDGAVERDNRGRPDGHQGVVERHDRSPVRILGPGGGRVNRCDGRLDVLLCEFGPRRRALQECHALRHKRSVPERPILIGQ